MSALPGSVGARLGRVSRPRECIRVCVASGFVREESIGNAVVDKLPEPLGIATIDGEAGAETREWPRSLALELGLEGLSRPAERGERDAQPEHAIREAEPRRLQRQERTAGPPAHGRLVEWWRAQDDHA